jgi:hypothetical protein
MKLYIRGENMKVLAKNKIESVLDRLGQEAEVIVPMQRGPQSGYFSWQSYDEDNDDLMLDALNVYLPPKGVVLPQTEKMYSFRQEGTEIDIDKVYAEATVKIIFGARGSDVQA